MINLIIQIIIFHNVDWIFHGVDATRVNPHRQTEHWSLGYACSVATCGDGNDEQCVNKADCNVEDDGGLVCGIFGLDED